ncbi:hypothetical protein Hypma_010859 [Hypsizygus marmoreus]|uniref:Uncharacterized protein n=1 Tax=Hypsizygus marmoreus TaxID=39966 RepID=A0A369JHX4_HYPMA|nr:hypothetical protein Hypma_010859 [Hypsizygus marmoreus]
MFSRTYYPSSAGSVIMPASTYGGSGYAGSGYVGSAYGGSYYGGGHYAAPMAPMPMTPMTPMMTPSYHAPSPIIMPSSSYHHHRYSYPAPMPYYGGASPTVIVSGRSSRHRRHSSRHRVRFLDF